ncbi:rrna-processing protein cgr1 [Ophiostoma piceae UAMH 11346]|uniref:rRNA-processing protein n=1 Tax=Ophiostoma piceae (strain UAMH 11346) TaxID=1262450 RepID=S3CZE1_OPHP1|nr:rrna-processing protein cgr1 [Ophiostoma piceae UAMH 11346]
MSDTAAAPEASASIPKSLGLRKNGKQWHAPKKAFRPSSGLTPYEKRNKDRIALATMKAKEKELKDEKEAAHEARVTLIRERRKAKEEKERYEKLATKMHAKRVERLKRKEKRNKLINT